MWLWIDRRPARQNAPPVSRRHDGAVPADRFGCLQGALHTVPFSEYLLYFDMHTRQLLQSTVDLLGALHLILFVVYMVVLIGRGPRKIRQYAVSTANWNRRTIGFRL